MRGSTQIYIECIVKMHLQPKKAGTVPKWSLHYRREKAGLPSFAACRPRPRMTRLTSRNSQLKCRR